MRPQVSGGDAVYWERQLGDYWGAYEQTKTGNHRPVVYSWLTYRPTANTVPAQFTLDTGAVKSVAPLSVAASLLGESISSLRSRLKPAGLYDVHGKELEGIDLPVTLSLISGDIESGMLDVQETIWFCEALNLKDKCGLLGQSFFEKLGVIFLNFPHAPEGRCFGLFRPPL